MSSVSFEMTNKTKCPHILIIEDDLSFKDMIVSLLSNRYIMHQASCAKEGFDLLQRKAVDIIIVDLILPDLEGVEIIKQIKANKETVHIPLIVLTGSADLQKIGKCLNEGAKQVISKDHDIIELEELLVKGISHCMGTISPLKSTQ